MQLPRTTYHVTGLWPDGDLLGFESRINRDDAFDTAGELVKQGCEVRIDAIFRDRDGAPTLARDVTSEWLRERMEGAAA